MNWLIYLALILSFFAVAAGLGFLLVRVLQAWRALKRLRRHVARDLGRLADAGERTAENAARAADTTEFEAVLSHLRVGLARFAVLRAALDEATGPVRMFTAFYPRK